MGFALRAETVHGFFIPGEGGWRHAFAEGELLHDFYLAFQLQTVPVVIARLRGWLALVAKGNISQLRSRFAPADEMGNRFR